MPYVYPWFFCIDPIRHRISLIEPGIKVLPNDAFRQAPVRINKKLTTKNHSLGCKKTIKGFSILKEKLLTKFCRK